MWLICNLWQSFPAKEISVSVPFRSLSFLLIVCHLIDIARIVI